MKWYKVILTGLTFGGSGTTDVSTSSSGGLQVSPIDHYGVQQYLAPNGEVVSVPLYKLVGDVFFDSVLDLTLWTPSVGTGGTAAAVAGQLELSTGTTANNSTSVQSTHLGRFSGLAPNKCRIPLQCPDGGTTNNTRRWGVFTTTDGAYFDFTGTTLSCVTRKAGVDTVQATAGTLNGQYGTTYTLGTTSHFYEIIYQPRQVVWLADNKIIHTASTTTTTWTTSLHLPLRYENNNIGGSTTNVTLQVRLGAIARFGIPEVQTDGYFISGTTAGAVIKRGPGNVHSMAISGVGNNSAITLYDNTAASGDIIFATGAMPINLTPTSLNLGGVAFNIGLTLVIVTTASNVLVVFD